MKRFCLLRVVALLLCFSLLPIAGIADTNDGTPVTRSDFSLSLRLHADGWPDDGAASYADWETLLNALSLRGVIDTQSFLQQYSRVYFNGGLYVDDKCAIPFEYDGYHSFRYVRSPALDGASVHFQMHNFFEFMLKGYYFMDLPTQLIALFMYPEASHYIGTAYYQPIAELLAGEGNRVIEYTDLYELAETLDLLVNEDWNERVYFYFTSLLISLGVSDTTVDKLSYLEGWLDYLDPEQQGMTITESGSSVRYVLGETTLFERSDSENGSFFTLTLPDADGYLLTLTYQNTGAELVANLVITLEDEERLSLSLNIDGMRETGDASGTAQFTLGGAAIENSVSLRFTYALKRGDLPGPVSFDLTWLHPQTGRPAMSILYDAQASMQPADVLVERVYDNQDDFFHLNESFMEEYKERFAPTLLLAFIPIVLKMPAGAINDAITFMAETGMLAFLGIE